MIILKFQVWGKKILKKKKKTKFLQDCIILSLIIACHGFSLTEVSKNVALNKNDFHIVCSAFLGDKNYLPPFLFSSLSDTIKRAMDWEPENLHSLSLSNLH